jgi:hypothetical protein
MAISTATQRMAISQLGGARQFLAIPSGAFEAQDRLMLIELYSFTVSGSGTGTRRHIGNKWYRNL